MFILNPQSGIPIYRQLLEQVRRMVASGQLAPGAELPSVRELALKHAVNPMTVSKAYSLLEAEGLLERNRGRPMTVANRVRNTSCRSTNAPNARVNAGTSRSPLNAIRTGVLYNRESGSS